MSTKTYKCPFCSYRATRENLGSHIEEEHEECIPKGMTANQIVFNTINHKDHGTCVVCKRPTKWNETACKYDRLCGRPQCQKALRDAYKKNMLRVHGKTTLLDDPEQQEKMLANRRISGKYKFTDGGYHVFTGKYEEKALEFMDKVMGFKSTDILSPGPTIEYIYKGKKLKWITDILLIPFNLVIEVKDGGSNPNNREMVSYREKQLAKEQMITNMGKFNYLRLTDNDFSQLLGIVAELKAQMIDDSEENKKVIINVNEEVNMLQEGTPIIFSEKDLVLNLDAWKNKELSVLYMVGLSGSGKSTLSEELSDEYDAHHIDTDKILWWLTDADSIPADKIPWRMEDWYGDTKVNTNIAKKVKYDKIFRKKLMEDYIKFIIGSNERFVIEGAFILDMYEYHSPLLNNAAFVIKGTSLTTSIIRRIKRDYGTPSLAMKRIPKIVNGYRNYISITNRMRDDMFEENLIDETVGSKFTKRYSGFNDLCKSIKTPSELNDWYNVNNIRWFTQDERVKRRLAIHSTNEDDVIVAWPDEIIKNHAGICFDHAIFMRLLCNRNSIENRMLYIGTIATNDKDTKYLGHIVCLYKIKDSGVYIFNYRANNEGSLQGPFGSYEEAEAAYKKYYFYITSLFLKLMPGKYHAKKVFSRIQKENLNVYDDYYNDRYATQAEIVKRIPEIWDMFAKVNKECHTDKITWLDEVLSKLDKIKLSSILKSIKGIFGESYIISESTAPEHLKELAKYIESIEEVPKQDDVSFKWPEDIEKYSKGNCIDVALFVHYYCKKNDIKNKLARLTIAYANNERSTFLNHQSHIICACYENNSWFIIQNSGLGDDLSALFTINSKSLEKTIEKFASIYMPRLSEYLISEKPDMVIDKIYYNVLSDKELESFDKKYYGENRPDKQKVFSRLFSKSSNKYIGESTIIDESDIGIERYKKKYTSFDAFCKDMQSPTDVLNWVKVNQCDWPKEFNAKDRSKGIHFYWPDDILRTKLGTCIDFALLMHFFCERKHIENYILRTSKYFRKYGDKEYHMFQHFMCIYKEKDGLYYVFNYQGKRSYGMKGPYSKPEDVRNEQLKMMKKHVMSVKNIIGKASDNDLCDIKYFAAIQDTKEYPIYDKFYGDKKIFRDDMMFKSKYMPSLICKYDSPNPEMHNDMYDNLKEKLTHLPKSIKAKLIYAASDWFNRTNDSMMESGELDDSVSTYEGESTNLSPIYYNYRGDNNMVLENAKPVKGPKELVRLYNNLEANFSYEERDDYFKDYKTKSPAEFEKLGYGICWDYADYEAKYLEKMGYKNTTADLSNGKYSLYYHQFNSDDGVNPTHTWVACMKGNKVYVVESSWYSFKGVHCFDNEQDMIAVYVSKLNEEKMPNLLMKYKPSRKFGLTTVKYMNHIYDTGTIVIDNVGMQESVSTYEGEYHSTDPNYESLIESVGVEHKERINYFISPKSEGAEILLANLACAGKDRFKEWFDPSEKFFSIIGKATASFYEKAGKEYEFLIIFNPKDTDADKRYNANQLCNYIQSMATGNGLVDTMRDKLFTYSGIMHIQMAKDLWLSYLILFGEDEIEKIFLVAYNMDTEWMELIPMPVPPMNTYRDSIAMEANLVPIPKPKDIKYIKSAEGIDNPYIMYDNKQYRVRVETLIFDKHGDVLVEMQDPKNLNKYGTNYKLPGGGLDKGRALDEQAEAECNEEALVVTKNRSYTGMTYFQNYEGKYPEWQKKKLWPLGLKYEGSLTFIFVAEYDKKFTGHIEDVDKDDFYQKAKYVGVDTIDWRAEHEEAIDFYFNHRDAIREGVDMDLNEFAGPGGMTPAPDLSYVTQYGPVHRDTGTGIMDMNVDGYAVSNDILTKNILTQDKSGMVKKENTEEFLKGRKLRVFQFRSDPEGLRIIENAIGTVQPRGFIYEALTGKKLLSDDQILCDESCTEVSPIDIGSEATSYLQTVAEQLKSIKGKKDHEFPLTNPHMIKEADAITEGLKDVVVMENQYGVYAKNAKTGMRTAYYQRIKDIPAKVVAKKNVKH